MSQARKSSLAGALLIIALVVVAYLPALQNGFIWDDDDHFTQNPAMLSVDGLKQIWSSLLVSRYYPLTLTTFWLERRAWDLQPLPYHAVNVALQAINALLLWALLRRLRVSGAWVAAALWAIHPVNVETVAWVTELKNTQSVFFFLLALLLMLRFEDDTRPRNYWLALGCGVAAMLSKPSTVVLPAMMLLCAWWRRGGWTVRDWLGVTPLAAFAAGMSFLTVAEQRGHIDTVGAADWTLTASQRLMLAGDAVWFYAAKVFWPANLCFIYPRWELPVHAALAWLPLAALAAAAGVLWRFRGTGWGRIAIFGLGWFVIGLLTVLGFFDIFFFLYSYVADHFQYLASIGLIVWATSTGTMLVERAGQWGERLGVLIVAAILLAFGLSTWRQAHIYHDDETLWRDTLAKNPQAWLAHNNLGVVLMNTGRIAEAISHYQVVLRLNPGFARGHYNLGVCLMKTGRTQDAIDQFQRSLQIQPKNAETECNLGVAFGQTGNLPAAIEHYEKALRIDLNFAGAHYNLGIALSQSGRESEAIAHWEQAVKSKPDYAEAQNNLGVALSHLGRDTEAIAHWEQAVKIKPDYAEAYNNLGVVFAQRGRLPEAIRQYDQALRINPAYAEAHNNLGAAFEQSGRVPEAIQQYEQALRFQPNLSAAQRSLARLQVIH